MPTEGVLEKSAMSPQNLKALYTVMYQRVLAVQSYDMTSIKPIVSPIILLKAATQTIRSIDEYFGLQQVNNLSTPSLQAD